MNELGGIIYTDVQAPRFTTVLVPLSIEQQTLAALERIEALLVKIADNTQRRGK